MTCKNIRNLKAPGSRSGQIVIAKCRARPRVIGLGMHGAVKTRISL